MKKTIITLLLSLVSFLGMSQSTAIKMKLHYWNKPEQNFNETLTINGKKLLDSTLIVSKIDTSKCIKVDKKDIIEYTSRKYLLNQKYLYVSYSNWDGKIEKEIYQNFKGQILNNKCKVILYHSTGDKIDDVTLIAIY